MPSFPHKSILPLLLVGAMIAVALPAVPSAAQNSGASGANSGGRPAIIRRGDPDEAEAPNTEPDEEAPSQQTAPQRANTPSRQNAVAAEPEPSGPRVLTPEDLVPDSDPMGANFADQFDPFDPPRDIRVHIDFDQADLNDVVMWISALTGRNFIIADTIASSKKITIISPRPVSIAEAYRAFIAALQMNGLTIVPFGSFLKIVEAGTAQQQATDISTNASQIPNDDRMVTHIHQLDHVSISTVQPVIDALKTESARIIAYEPTNSMIITETGNNMRRLLDVIRRLDVPSGQEQINMYQVRYADAEELKSLLLELFQRDEQQQQQQATRTTATSRRARRRQAEEEAAAAAASTTVSGEALSSVTVSEIISDTRTNQLIIISTARSYERMLTIIEQLDVPIPGEGQIHVLFLENADATELASTLQSLTQSVEEQNNAGQGATTTRRRAAAQASDNDSAAAGPVTATFSGDISITADEPTNALVVVASLRDFLTLSTVVEQLDRRRQQVYVEAVIMEIRLSRRNELGLTFHGGGDPGIGGDSSPVAGGTGISSLASLATSDGFQGLALGIQGAEIPGISDVLGIGLPSFGAILQAIQTDDNVNVLSTPHILTMDNEEAEIVVGENVPFVTSTTGAGSLGSLTGLLGQGSAGLGGLGSLAGLGSLGGVNIQRQDVALTLRITPQINESDFVRLEIEQQIDDISSDDEVRGPTTTTRQIRTTVSVQDQQTVVLGGLMRDSTRSTVSKVPVLGDIPLLGHLFRDTNTTTVKNNLLLLLTPYIIRDPQDFQEIFRRKMQEREEFMAWFGRRGPEYVRSVDYARKDGPIQSMFETITGALDSETQRRRAFGTDTTEVPLVAPEMEPIRIRIEDLDPEPGTEAPANP